MTYYLSEYKIINWIRFFQNDISFLFDVCIFLHDYVQNIYKCRESVNISSIYLFEIIIMPLMSFSLTHGKKNMIFSQLSI